MDAHGMAVVWIGRSEALRISYSMASRLFQIERRGGGLDRLTDENGWMMRNVNTEACAKLLQQKESKSCLDNNAWLREWGVKVILFWAGCRGQEALGTRTHRHWNAQLKLVWPSTRHHCEWLLFARIIIKVLAHTHAHTQLSLLQTQQSADSDGAKMCCTPLISY